LGESLPLTIVVAENAIEPPSGEKRGWDTAANCPPSGRIRRRSEPSGRAVQSPPLSSAVAEVMKAIRLPSATRSASGVLDRRPAGAGHGAIRSIRTSGR
jgi:hypothetical protein